MPEPHASSFELSARFQLLSTLGSGGFGAVHEAVELRTGRRVALKELAHASADNLARFKHEFRALADCHHPNLVALHELMEEGGRWIIVMELVPGCDFATWVAGERPGGDGKLFDEGRLRSALTGMVVGLDALHGFGILHRDLKPSNVRIRPDGRAVLLDFGLVTSVHTADQSMHGAGVGTARYMAPEQAAGEPIGTASDFYALGVCLFEALTGRAPFEHENAVAVMLDKQAKRAPLASSLRPDVPPDLDALCARLLATAASERPAAAEVLRWLGGDAGSAPRPRAAPAALAPLVFAGREPELAYLERALTSTDQGTLQVVLIEGESGVGKSELVAEFLRRSSARHPELLALRGRCYENEQVSYKAFDGCIDELSRWLQRLPASASATLLPARAALLGQLFPVLRLYRPIAQASGAGSSADPTARRLEAFAALAELLEKLAEERPVVLVVDDLQWADAESFRLLVSLMERAPPVLLLATVRPREELEIDVLPQVNALRLARQTGVVQLFGLPPPEARALAAELLGPAAPEAWLDLIASESDGHPLFLAELVQYTHSHDFGARRTLTLDAALGARTARLEPPARSLLELVALAGRPYGSHVFERALGGQDVDEAARLLLSTGLLKLRKGRELGCYHDRVRRVVVELLPRARLAAMHRQLAVALANTPESDAAEQARHWDLAGEPARAIAAYERAASQAFQALAFTRAAELCARGIALVADAADERTERLRTERARALACAGQSQQAALLYQEAADLAYGETRVRLQSRAAQQLMLAAKVQQGFVLARGLLVELGVSMPRGVVRSLLRYAWDKLWLALHRRRSLSGLARRGPVDSRRRLAMEVIDELGQALWLAQPLSMLTLATQHMRMAAELGATGDTAFALTLRGWLTTFEGSLSRALPLFERARRLLDGQSGHLERARQAHLEGSARMAGFDWTGGQACLERAQQILQEHCPDVPWLSTNVRYHLGMCWYQLGAHRRLADELARWLAEAQERNDALGFALLTGMGHGFVRHLCADDPAAALEERERALAACSPEPYTFAHFGHFLGRCVTSLYQGGPTALRFLDGYEAEYASVPLLKTRVGRDTRLIFRTLATLSACVGAPTAERELLLRASEKFAQKLERGSPLMRSYGLLTRAQIDALENRTTQALASARAACVLAEGLAHGTRRHAALLEGLLAGDAAGRARAHAVIAYYRAEGWKDPLRGLAIALPALPLLHGAGAGAGEAAERGRSQQLVGRFELLQPLDSGGFGRVIAARNVDTGQKLALKELTRQGGKPLERFKREFRALSDLHHPNLARLDGLFQHDGRWYIAMELVEGRELLLFARPDGHCDLARTIAVFAGLARGLMALHEAGLVHRDVAPSNVRVTHEGRPVLLDFGLVARRDEHDDDAPLGTLPYAAPEQLAGAPPDPRADIYALGSCLYEALYGPLPFAGGTPAALNAQQRQGPSLVPAASRELEALSACCRSMLETSPAARPTLPAILAALERAAGRTPSSEARELRSFAPPPQEVLEAGFAGREGELARLRDTFLRTRRAGCTFALVQGESGIGKSALVSEFAREMVAARPSLRVVRSRCYENEQGAFKAFDGVVEHFAALLSALPETACEALLPKRAALLAQLFPVLTSVAAVAHASKKGLPADPTARRLAARHCFVELLEKLTAQHDFLFVVDDLQWADAESFALLELLIGRPTLPLFFLCTVRPEAELVPEVASAVARLLALPTTEPIRIDGLTHEAARALAEKLNGAPLDPTRLEALVRESKGHPLFLRELVAHEQSGAAATGASLTLDDALRARIARYGEDARQLLALVALAGRPLGEHVFARAMGRSKLPREAIITLLAHGLLRRRGHDELGCYHDRIRAVASALLTPALRQALASSLAAALELENVSEPADRARLWEEAEDGARALAAYAEAGERALEGLAFARAEQLFARALELLAPMSRNEESEERLRGLHEQRGHALARAGRSGEAARVYQQAAVFARGDAKVRLRMWAAQHLIQSAQVDEGMRAAQTLLGELGVSLPKSDNAALGRMAWERARVAVRGTALEARPAERTQRERLLLEALRGLSGPVRAISYLPGSTLVAQYLRLALDAGDPLHAARALACEGLFRVLARPARDQTALFERSRKLAEATYDHAVIAEVELLRGLVDITQSRFAAAAVRLGDAHELLRTHCPGEPWLLSSARILLSSAWLYSGDFAALVRHTGGWLEEARARADRYAIAALAGFGCASTRLLVHDEPAQALEELEAAMAPWPDAPFSTNHFGAFNANGIIRCYLGGPELLAWLDGDRRERQRAYLMRRASCRLSESSLTMIAIVYALESASGSRRSALLRRAEGELCALERNPTQIAVGIAHLHRGVLRAVAGDSERAQQHLAQAAQQLAMLGHYLEPAARYLAGVLEGGDGGREKRDGVLTELRAEGWTNEPRALHFRVPGLSLLA